jgi:hypothetical protein
MKDYVKNINRPEWGVGLLVEVSGDRYVVDFPMGRKIILGDYIEFIEVSPNLQGQLLPGDAATEIWLDRLNNQVIEEINQGNVPFLGNYLEQLTQPQRERFRSYLKKQGKNAIRSFISGLKQRPAAFSALTAIHFCCSSGTSSSGKIASTGHSGAHASQSMHASGSMYIIVSSPWKQSTGHTTTQSVNRHLSQFPVTT